MHSSVQELPRLLTVAETAALLRVSRRSIYRWSATGDLPCQHVRRALRFRRGDVLRWLDKQRQTRTG